MMRRPIFLAYHTELSMLLVAAAAAVKVEVVCRLLCASSRSCCRVAAEVVLAGEQTMGGGLHSTSCLPPPHRSKQGGCRGADGGTDRGDQMLLPGEELPSREETRRGRPPPVGDEQRRAVNGSLQTPDLTEKRER